MIIFFQLFCSFSVVSLLMYTLIILYNCRFCEQNGMYYIFILPINFNKIKKYFQTDQCLQALNVCVYSIVTIKIFKLNIPSYKYNII